jgi:hypothetical protein
VTVFSVLNDFSKPNIFRVSLQTRIKSEKGSLVSDWTHLEIVMEEKKKIFLFFIEALQRKMFKIA